MIKTLLTLKSALLWAPLLVMVILSLIFWYRAQLSSGKEFTYKQTPQGKLTIRVHFPRNKPATTKQPAIVFFFGGGWVSGSMAQFHWFADYYARKGLVAMRVDYRVSSRHNTMPDKAVRDAQDALRWIQRNASKLGIKKENIIVVGGSAGGHLAACTALCGTDNRYLPSSLILLNPVLDLTSASPELEFTSGELQLIEGMDKNAAANFSPNKNFSSTPPPTLLLVGGNDPLISQAKEYKTQAEKLGSSVTLKVAPQQNHGFYNYEPWRTLTAKEIDRYLIARSTMLPTERADSQESNSLSFEEY